jgi:plastocyanin
VQRRLAIATIALSATLVVAGCGSDKKSDDAGTADSGGAAAKTVDIKAANFSFTPSAVELKAGDKVTFSVTNGDTVEHNLTIEDLKVDTDVEAGKTATVSATPKAGTYQYHCEYHPQKMTGTITVT